MIFLKKGVKGLFSIINCLLNGMNAINSLGQTSAFISKPIRKTDSGKFFIIISN